MSWFTRGTNSSTGQAAWFAGQVPGAPDYNAFGLDVRTWGGDVNAAGHNLLNLAGISGQGGAVAVTGNLSVTGIFTVRSQTASYPPANAPSFELWDGGDSAPGIAAFRSGGNFNQYLQLSTVNSGLGHGGRGYAFTPRYYNGSAYVNGASFTIADDGTVLFGGSVGINCTAPKDTLDVNGGLKVSGGSYSGMGFGDATQSVGSSGAYIVRMNTGMTGYGDVLHVGGWAGVYFHASDTPVSPGAVKMAVLPGGVGIGISPTYLFQLGSDSAAKPSTSTWTVASDARLKRRIQPLSGDPIGRLGKLVLKQGEYNGLGGTQAGARWVSIIAQEARVHYPNSAHTFRAKLNADDTEDTELIGWNWHEPMMDCIAAVPLLAAQIAALDARLKKGNL